MIEILFCGILLEFVYLQKHKYTENENVAIYLFNCFYEVIYRTIFVDIKYSHYFLFISNVTLIVFFNEIRKIDIVHYTRPAFSVQDLLMLLFVIFKAIPIILMVRSLVKDKENGAVMTILLFLVFEKTQNCPLLLIHSVIAVNAFFLLKINKKPIYKHFGLNTFNRTILFFCAVDYYLDNKLKVIDIIIYILLCPLNYLSIYINYICKFEDLTFEFYLYYLNFINNILLRCAFVYFLTMY